MSRRLANTETNHWDGIQKYLFPSNLLAQQATRTRFECLRLVLLVLHREDESDAAVRSLLAAIPAASSLRRISLQMGKTTDETVKVLSRFHSLTKVDLDWCREVTNEGLAGLTSSTCSIETLNLARTKVNDDGLELLSTFSNLKELILSYTTTKIKTGMGLKHLKDLPNLQSLEWYAHGSSADTNSVSLQALCDGFDSLKKIKFRANTITDEHVACIATCPKLERVAVSKMSTSEITDDGFKAVGELKHLKVLRMSSESKTDAGVAHLSGLENLEYLDIGLVSDKSLETTLANLPNLRVLDLGRSFLSSPASLEKLQTSNPNLSIIVDYMSDCSKSEGACVYRLPGTEYNLHDGYDGFDFGDYLD